MFYLTAIFEGDKKHGDFSRSGLGRGARRVRQTGAVACRSTYRIARFKTDENAGPNQRAARKDKKKLDRDKNVQVKNFWPPQNMF